MSTRNAEPRLSAPPALTERFLAAVSLAERVHGRERRAGTENPYLAHLPAVTDDAILRVALADKVHNARSIVRDYREEGHALWDQFTQKTAGDQLWYYGGLLAFFEKRRPGPLTEDLQRAVGELIWLVERDRAQDAVGLDRWPGAEIVSNRGT